MRRFPIVLLFLCGASLAGEQLSERSLQVAPGVTLAGTLDPGAVATLKASDTLVIDLRGTDEGSDAEARAMALAGVDYVHLPQSASAPDKTDVEYLRDLLAVNAHRGVVIHCRSGNRAGLLWGAYRLDQGEPLPAVLDEIKPIATNDVIRKAVADYAQSPGTGGDGSP